MSAELIQKIIAAFPDVEFIYDDRFKNSADDVGHKSSYPELAKDGKKVIYSEHLHVSIYDGRIIDIAEEFIEKIKVAIGDQKKVYTCDLMDCSKYGLKCKIFVRDGISIRNAELYDINNNKLIFHVDMIMGFEK